MGMIERSTRPTVDMRRKEWVSGVLAMVMGCTPSESGSPTPVVTPSVEVAPPSEPSRPITTARSTDPSWHEIAIDDGCVLGMARTPAALDLPPTWTPCNEGPEGCLESTTALSDEPSMASMRVAGVTVGSQVFVTVTIPLPGPRTRMLAGPLDGRPFLAVELEEREECSLGQLVLDEGGGVLEVAYDGAEGYASRAYLQGLLGEDPQWHTVAARLLRADHPRFIGESVARVGDRPFVLASGGPLLHADPDGNRWTAVEGSRHGWTCCLGTSGEVLTLLRESIPEVVVGSRLGATMVPLLQPARGEGVSAVRSHGPQAVWVQGSGRNANNEYRHVELWTGRLEPTPAIVERRKVAELRSDHVMPPVVGPGVALVWEHDRKTGTRRPVIVRLASGERHELPSMSLRRVLWLGEQELAVELGPIGNVVGPLALRRLPLPS